MKVYCKNCKYRKNNYCNNHMRVMYVYLIILSKNMFSIRCEYMNANNDCKDYRRKWWKFWVNK